MRPGSQKTTTNEFVVERHFGNLMKRLINCLRSNQSKVKPGVAAFPNIFVDQPCAIEEVCQCL